jgi:hypothetical protein
VLVPDWRNPEDYGFTDSLTLDQWAWQFLRRNPKYVEDWREILLTFLEFIRDHGTDEASRYFCQGGTTDHRGEDFCVCTVRLRDRFGKWGTAGYYNPETDDPTRLAFLQQLLPRSHPAPAAVYSEEDIEKLGIDPRRVTVPLDFPEVVHVFDLSRPIKPQVESVGRTLQAQQRWWTEDLGGAVKATRRRKSKWPLYLRALDASSAGATYEEMAEVFFPLEDPDSDVYHLRQVDNHLQQARRLLEPEHYLDILSP